MALSIYSLFKVDIENLVRSKVDIAKDFNIGWFDIGNMPYWEFELLVDEIVDIAEKEKEKQDEQEGKYDANSFVKNSNSMVRNTQRQFSMPSTPSLPNISTPKIPSMNL